MRFRQYLKDHWILFLCLFFAMLLISCLLLIMRLSGEGILFYQSAGMDVFIDCYFDRFYT